METKKISFGFSKVKKPDKVVREEEKRDYIECVEEKSIKVVGGDVVIEKKPLVIPMMQKTKSSLEALAKIAEKVESDDVSVPAEELTIKVEPKEGETLEERAAREIIEDLKNVKTEDHKVYSLPIAQSNQVEGKEATIEEYENIPITEFGLAMLRGMGWAPAKDIGKKDGKLHGCQPQPRPKGLGLGADRVVNRPPDNNNKNAQGQTEKLKMVKGACVKICNGSHAGSYGQISGFDEDSGRIIVELAVKKMAINISEFMIQLVSKQVYQDQSRIINSVKVEEYKTKELNSSNLKENTSSKSEPKQSRRRDDTLEGNIKSRKDLYSKNQRDYNDQCDHKDQRDREEQRDSKHHRDYKDQHDHKPQDDKYHRDYKDLRDDKYQCDYKDRHDNKNQRDYVEKPYQRNQEDYKDYRDRRDQHDLDKDKYSTSKSSSKRDARHSSSEEENSRISKNWHRKKDATDSDSDSHASGHRRRKDDKKRDLRGSSSSPEVQRKDKDKKRKGKKKRRDRSRSPNYRKYKK